MVITIELIKWRSIFSHPICLLVSSFVTRITSYQVFRPELRIQSALFRISRFGSNQKKDIQVNN